MQMNSLALVMLVPYDGCNMVQEGGSYMLPMLWQGIPVSLWCNKPPATTPAPATTSAQPQDPVPQTLKYPPSYPQVPLIPPKSMNPGVQQSYVFAPYWGYPHYHSVPTTTTAAPMATLTTTAKPAAKDPEAMVQSPGYPPFYPWYLPGPLPTPAETTTTTQKMTTKPTTTQSQFPQLPKFPPYGPFQPFPHYHWPLPGPLPTPAETTTTQKVTTKPTTTQSQFPQLPKFPPYGPFQPFPHYHWPLPGPLPTPAETTTTQK
ncbi:extensin isoform X2 [Hippoglossus stenolepis]|uniref:extensin isoform X2 n=1 Tax=Hippoglossus stenolepis TaxID=195615 RepID=UPI001FAF124F|nr:extensin isoform X2 [Hippoglossus stenolepis]